MFTGIKIKRLHGLEVYQVIVRGCLISTHMSETGARIKCLRLVRGLKEIEAKLNS